MQSRSPSGTASTSSLSVDGVFVSTSVLRYQSTPNGWGSTGNSSVEGGTGGGREGHGGRYAPYNRPSLALLQFRRGIRRGVLIGRAPCPRHLPGRQPTCEPPRIHPLLASALRGRRIDPQDRGPGRAGARPRAGDRVPPPEGRRGHL